MALSDELAQRRLAQFETRHGARLVEFAAAASLPVVLDPRLVHLLRINFFVDGDPPLPWTAESDLLFSPLCTDLDDGLFEIEPTIRAALLGRLQRDGGPARIRDIASLLWAYLHQRPAPWAHEPGLERAQELTALQVLDPRACEVWLERAQAAVDRDVRAERPWFVAIQRKLQPWKDLLDRRERARALRARLEAIAAETAALRSLDFLAEVRPPLRYKVDTALLMLQQLEHFARQAQDLIDDELFARMADLDDLDERIGQARFILLYSALLRLPFEQLVAKARDAGWGQRGLREVTISGRDGLAHRWLAARLHEEREETSDSSVFVLRYSITASLGGVFRRLLGPFQNKIALQLNDFNFKKVDQWTAQYRHRTGRTLPDFVWSTTDSLEQILFNLAKWMGLDTARLSHRLACAPIRQDEAVASRIAPVRPDGRDVRVRRGRNVFTAIGISRYQHWGNLRNPVEDTMRVAALFQKLGFESTDRLLDGAATHEAMQRLVSDDLASLGPEDSLVLFYAGRATTLERHVGDDVVRIGYLIPVDARRGETVIGWLDLESWLRMVSVLPAKHILVILDVCGPGVALDPVIRWRSAQPDESVMPQLQARRSRRIITSGLWDQGTLDDGPVRGCSLFAGCVIEALERDLARHRRERGDPSALYTTGSELGHYVQRRVSEYSDNRQTPDFGALSFDDRGELLIPLLGE